MTIDLLSTDWGPKRERFGSTNRPTTLFFPLSDPYLPERSPTSYWSKVPVPAGGETDLSTRKGL